MNVNEDRFILFNYVLYNRLDINIKLNNEAEISIFKRLKHEYREVKNGDDVCLIHFNELLLMIIEEEKVHELFDEIVSYNNMEVYHLIIEYLMGDMELFEEIDPYVLDEIKLITPLKRHKLMKEILNNIKVYKLIKWKQLRLNHL